MRTRTSLYVSCPLVLILIFSIPGIAQEANSDYPVRLMFYNVENLFDTFDDPHRNDNEFLPNGVRRWNKSRYYRKISSVYKTVLAAGGWSPPAVAAFCEVENRGVLEDLVYGTYLSRYNYGIIHEDSPDERGIDVCLIYRKDIVSVIYSKSWIPLTIKREDFHTRSVLYAKCLIYGDTLHLIVNHWPSRRGGVLAGENTRNRIAEMVRNSCDSLLNCSSGRAKIIVMGDFNCDPGDDAVRKLTEPAGGKCKMINLSAAASSNGRGTYYYSGMWETIDQVIVSGFLTGCREGLSTGQEHLSVFRPEFLLTDNPGNPGDIPFSTYRGYKYQGGFSDHLPVLLDLVLRRSGNGK